MDLKSWVSPKSSCFSFSFIPSEEMGFGGMILYSALCAASPEHTSSARCRGQSIRVDAINTYQRFYGWPPGLWRIKGNNKTGWGQEMENKSLLKKPDREPFATCWKKVARRDEPVFRALADTEKGNAGYAATVMVVLWAVLFPPFLKTPRSIAFTFRPNNALPIKAWEWLNLHRTISGVQWWIINKFKCV